MLPLSKKHYKNMRWFEKRKTSDNSENFKSKDCFNTSQFIKYKKIVTNNDKMDIKWKWWYKSKGLSPSDLKIKNIQK